MQLLNSKKYRRRKNHQTHACLKFLLQAILWNVSFWMNASWAKWRSKCNKSKQHGTQKLTYSMYWYMYDFMWQKKLNTFWICFIRKLLVATINSIWHTSNLLFALSETEQSVWTIFNVHKRLISAPYILVKSHSYPAKRTVHKAVMRGNQTINITGKYHENPNMSVAMKMLFLPLVALLI